jgi:dynein regulatory complex protein 1
MNEEEAKDIMRKVLQADRIIYEQQLGMKWEPPSQDLFRNVDPLSFHSLSIHSPTTLNEAEAAFENGMSARTSNDQEQESLSLRFHESKQQSKTMKKTLELLCNEAGFLVEDKLQKLLAPLHKDEQSLMRLDSIFKALGVETVEDIEKLTSYFVKEDDSINPQTRAKMISDDQAALIHPNEVVKTLRKFVESNRSKMGRRKVRTEEGEEGEEGEEEEENEERAKSFGIYNIFNL